MKTLLKRNFESSISEDFFVSLTDGESSESNSLGFRSYVLSRGCTFSWIPNALSHVSHRSGLVMPNAYIIYDQDSELTRVSMELSANSFKELWDNEDDNYWNQYL